MALYRGEDTVTVREHHHRHIFINGFKNKNNALPFYGSNLISGQLPQTIDTNSIATKYHKQLHMLFELCCVVFSYVLSCVVFCLAMSSQYCFFFFLFPVRGKAKRLESIQKDLATIKEDHIYSWGPNLIGRHSATSNDQNVSWTKASYCILDDWADPFMILFRMLVMVLN